MSLDYEDCDRIPSEVLCKRLDELSDAVTKGDYGLRHEFDMRIPAENDRDADLVLIKASGRIAELEDKLMLSDRWPLADVVEKLIDASMLADEHLDVTGHEQTTAAIEAGKAWLQKYKS